MSVSVAKLRRVIRETWGLNSSYENFLMLLVSYRKPGPNYFDLATLYKIGSTFEPQAVDQMMFWLFMRQPDAIEERFTLVKPTGVEKDLSFPEGIAAIRERRYIDEESGEEIAGSQLLGMMYPYYVVRIAEEAEANAR